MSPLLQKVLADVVGEASQNENRLDVQERIQVIAHVAIGLQQPSQSSQHKLSRKDLFGCLRGQITMAEDFNAPLSDFGEYM
jgi:Protein of unknown function (DUF2281)